MSLAEGRVRWWLKKGSRSGMALLAWGSGWLALRTWIGRHPRVRVLTYHRFGDIARDPFCIRVEDFERQMAWLARHGRAVSLADVQAFLAGRTALPDGSVLVTIDDGCPSLYWHAFPILQRYCVPAVAFVPAGEMAMNSGEQLSDDRDERSDARLTWSQLKAMAAAGILVGSHAWTHCSLRELPGDAVQMQLQRSRQLLQTETGQCVASFAYPFGTRADYSEATAVALRECGYECGFTSQHGAIRTGADRFTLPRVKVEGGESLWMFRLLVQGALDGWRWVDRIFWRFQAREV